MNKTAGQIFTDTMRATFQVGTRTGRYGKVFGYRTDLHDAMIEAIENAVQLPGYFSAEKTEIFRTAWGAAMSYRKHIGGYRADAVLISKINKLSAYQFVALLGRMIDAEVTNVGEGERFFAAERVA